MGMAHKAVQIPLDFPRCSSIGLFRIMELIISRSWSDPLLEKLRARACSLESVVTPFFCLKMLINRAVELHGCL